MFQSILAISLGAATGAVARWMLGLSLNSLFPDLPPGTLVANLLGGYLIGIAVALFANNPDWSPEWRLLVVTGFLGGLTTFSTFSAEVTLLIQEQRLLMAGATIASHVVGSVSLTLLGIATVSVLRRT